ncbi:conserved hypothetical protein [Ricinus communis]|uniref:Uncharacterized protein n=1 Tax=Ricinus communis TaxID=3988 RepID=B9RE44_RICCO|nr:conserved hypothetical protein [Ricinus communis]|eukprot:XP_002511983.1 uncharacterized protein LOC8264537 [Ricinus communis]
MVLASSSPPESEHASASSPKRLTLGFLMSISSLMAICAKHAGRVSNKLKTASFKTSHHHHRDHEGHKSPKLLLLSPKSPLVRPKQLLTQISNKAITFVHSKKKRDGTADVVAPDEFGDGGVWQKAILMGDKCQPLDFSGVIYYDSCGKQLNQLPLRSPRASPLPGYLTRGN